ncbi:hypothetical protein [Draconibacterium sp.]|uniref:hypothetical protein n=1 Tax=Draconibacterium sp. TaxID=1965318 RepID=UPI003568378B
MTIDFRNVMAQKSDSDLLEIVTKLKDDYQPEAVVAAQNEIEKRNLTGAQIEQTNLEIEEKEKKNHKREDEPLSAGQKMLFLIFFWGIIPWAMAGTFKADGYTKKYKDAWKFMKIGMGIFIGIPLLLILIFQFLSS